MIAAKTRMKKIPNTCKECRVSYIDWTGSRFCNASGRDCPMEMKKSGNMGYYRPSWCPLVEISDQKKGLK